MRALLLLLLAHLATCPPQPCHCRGLWLLPIFLFRGHCPHYMPSTPPFQPMEEGLPRPPRPHCQGSPGCAKKSRRVPSPPRNAKNRQDAPRPPSHAVICTEWSVKRPWSRFRPVRSTQYSQFNTSNSIELPSAQLHCLSPLRQVNSLNSFTSTWEKEKFPRRIETGVDENTE